VDRKKDLFFVVGDRCNEKVCPDGYCGSFGSCVAVGDQPVCNCQSAYTGP